MKLFQIIGLSFAAITLTISPSYADGPTEELSNNFDAGGSTSTDMVLPSVEGVGTTIMSISEVETGSGRAFSAGMVVNPAAGTSMINEASVLDTNSSEFEKSLATDGSVISETGEALATTSATAKTVVGNTIESTIDESGTENEAVFPMDTTEEN